MKPIQYVAAAPFLLAILAATPALAADPCGGVALQGGVVAPGRTIAPAHPIKAADAGCLKYIGAELARRRVRTVTVAVRLPEAKRRGGLGARLGKSVAGLLAAGGVPAARISTVSPAVGKGRAELRVTFTERKARRPVARILSVSGQLFAGRDKKSLRPAVRGDRFPPRTWLETRGRSRAGVLLAEGSEITLAPGTLLRIGRLRLNAALKREVHIDVSRGGVDTRASRGGAGSVFELRSRVGVAGVRGTAFRVTLVGQDKTRLETLSGLVELAGSKARVNVGAGQGSLVDAAGKPLPPRALLAAAAIVGPLKGALGAARGLSWKPVKGAVRYRVELARDAYFLLDVAEHLASAPDLTVPAAVAGGKWYWRVTAIDSDGFVGQPSRVHAFVLPSGT